MMIRKFETQSSDELIAKLQGKGYEVISVEIGKWSYWYADYITVCYKSKYITFANAKEVYRFGAACFSELNEAEAENKIKKIYEELK